METIGNLTAVCPAFGGITGNIFAQAIATIITAHCAHSKTSTWPEDNTDYILQQNRDELSYDFIIIGAGTAGSILANRLSKALPSMTFLVVEAGGDPEQDTEIPGFLFMAQNLSSDWQYKTHPDNKTCKGFVDNQCVWSKGKAMGGSTSINAMIYIRGHPTDFDGWTENNKEWGYKNILPYFEEIEANFEKHVTNEKVADVSPLYDILFSSWKELGYKELNQNNYDALIGMRVAKLHIAKGERYNLAKINLQLANKNNVHIMKNSVVRRLLIDANTKRVNAIEVNIKDLVVKIKTTKEVILSAGTIASPQLLMLSGVGPKEHLIEKGIKIKNYLPVGQNLQDHIMVPIFLQINEMYSKEVPNEEIVLSLVKYMLTKSGPLSNIGITDFITFVNVKNENNKPDIQFLHSFFPRNDQFVLQTYLKSIGYKDEIITAIRKLNKQNSLFAIFPLLLHPKSRGEILLSDMNPLSKPIIKANYLTNVEDYSKLIKAIRLVEKMTTTTSFKQLGITIGEVVIDACSKVVFNSAKYWKCYLNHMATTLYHPVGTCKMGNSNEAVVNSELKVHGIQNLRVVDASIMPSITGGNTMAPTMMIAEKASDMIAKQYSLHDEL